MLCDKRKSTSEELARNEIRYDKSGMISPDIAIEEYVRLPISYNSFNEFCTISSYKINLNKETTSYYNEV